MSEHALVVPPIGIIQILHGDDTIDPENTLRGLYPSDSPYVGIHFHLHDGTGGDLGFFPRLVTANPRAREALRILTDTHMVLTGPVIFTGVPEPRLGQVLATLSLEDH